MDSADKIDFYHFEIRKKLLEEHPSIRPFAHARDRSFALILLLHTLTQLFIAIWLSYQPLSLTLLFTLLVGPLYNFAAFALFHEACHDAALPRHWPRIFYDALLLVANLPLAAGVVAPFYYEHRAHHAKLGSYDDLKYPTVDFTAKFDRNKFTRFLYILIIPIVYLYRINGAYYIMENKSGKWKWVNRINHTSQVLFLWSLYYFFGPHALTYILGGVYLNYSIMYQGLKNQSDHAVGWDNRTHTYSSYDAWNLVNANIGHHREHHDFPSCPGRYLPVIAKIAEHFYKEEDKEHCQQTFYSNTIDIFNSKVNEGLTRLSPKM